MVEAEYQLSFLASAIGRHVEQIDAATAIGAVVRNHYLHRACAVQFAYGLIIDSQLMGVVTFGAPPSRHLQIGACGSAPDRVIELNRLWVSDTQPRNTESWFLARALRLLPPRIVVSFADTSCGHIGYVYRAANFYFAGATDSDRKTPRFDYVTDGKHSRAAFRRGGRGLDSERIRRKPKMRYWTITGTRREQRALAAVATWPRLSWTTE